MRSRASALPPASRTRSGARCLSGIRFPRCRRRSRRHATAAGGWLCSRTPTADLLEASLARIGVEFELTVVASEIGSYKPAPAHWDEFFARSGADRASHVHVAASLFHDIAPASTLGLRTIWINRLGEEAEPQPDVELRSLAGLADSLDSLVPS